MPALAAFALLQRRTSARNGHPLIRWSLFHQRSFVAGSVLSLVFFLGVAPFFFVFSVYLQTGLGFSALATGLTVPPSAVTSVEHGFKACFHARATKTDPTIVPPVCQQFTADARSPSPPAVTAAIQRAVNHAVSAAERTNFSRSIQQTLFYEIVVCVLSCLLVGALPRTSQTTAW